jgi:MFS family permease
LKRYGDRSLLALRDFRLLLAAWGLSALGDFLTIVTLTLRVEEHTNSGFAVSGLLFFAALPLVAMTALAGWVVDRFETKAVLALTAALQGLCVLALAAVDSLAATYALVFALNLGGAIERPALFALIPRVVGEARTAAAYATFESLKYATVTLGFLLGGVLTGALGTSTTLLVDAGTFAVNVAAALALRTRRRPAPAHQQQRTKGAMTAGLRLIGRDRLLRTMVLVLAGSILFGGIDNVANVFLAKDALHIGDAGYGALAAAWGAGMIAGAVLAGRRVRAPDAAVVVVAAVVAMGAAILLTAPAPVVWTALVTLALGGVGNGLANVSTRVLLQSRVEDALRGRVYAAYQACLSIADFTALAAGGALIQLVGARWTLAIAGGGCLLVGLCGLPAVRRRT